ncbi:glutathione S-transferase family protein [Ferrovibrio sp.]|uniref:glutathione S-transferase family protein n=1 Tax=Ferrovibrio sp. TaxID=1917215 RepID=UPI00311D48DE
MAITLYDLAGADDRRFSPHCWKTRMALAHKGLAFDAVPTRFTEIRSRCGGAFRTVPILEDGGRQIVDSWAIAEYLEATYADRPSLFGGPAGKAHARFVQNWAQTQLHPQIVKLIIHDIYTHLAPEDHGYFRESREKFLGTTLEQAQAGREERVAGFRAALEPARQTLKAQPFIGGEAPLYADYVLFGPLQWARVTGRMALLAEDDPVQAWFLRLADLYDGMGRRMPGYWPAANAAE